MKKTMLRTLALVLSLLMMLSLAACGGEPAPTEAPATEAPATEAPETEAPETEAPATDEVVEITYSFWGAESEAESFDKTIAKFHEEYPNIKVNPMVIPWESYMEKLNTMATAGNLPDCGLMQEANTLYWAQAGMLADLGDMYDGADGKPLSSAVFSYNGTPVAYAVANNSLMMFYNKDMFDAAGVAYPPVTAADAWDWDTFVDVAKQLTLDANGNNAKSPDFDANNIVQYGCMVENLTWQLEVWCRSNGSGFYNDNGSEVTIGDAKAIEAIQRIADLHTVHHVAPLSSGLTDDGVSRSLIAGTVAMTTNGAWNIGTCLAAAREEGLNYGVAVLPHMGTPVTIATGGPNVVFNQSKNLDAAKTFIKWYSREENNWDGLIATGIWAPILDTYYAGGEMTDKWLNNPNMPAYDEAKAVMVDYVNECAVPTSWAYTANTSDFNALLGAALGDVWTGSKTAEEAINENLDALKDAHAGFGA